MQPATSNFRRAFSFIEVLFAVILLGIGFIMIAGVFPVAIQQTAAVSDETQGTLIVRDAIRKIQAVADGTIPPPPSVGNTSSLFQPTNGTVEAFSNNLILALGADTLYSADRRYGWVGFYRRDSATSPYAQVFVIALQNPNFPNYLSNPPANTIPPAPVPPPIPPNTYNPAPLSAIANPTAAAIQANFSYDNTINTTTVTLTYTNPPGPNGAVGAYLIVAGPVSASNPPPNLIGRIFRLGIVPSGATSNSTTQTFTLQPGWDITNADVPSGSPNPYTFTANVWLIGAAPTLNTSSGITNDYTGPFSGPNQDIAAASAFIRVNTTNN